MLQVNKSKIWYEQNKEFLRKWELSKEFKSYRSLRMKTKRCKDRLNYVQETFDSIKSPRKREYLLFYYAELKRLRLRYKKLIQEQEKGFLEMKKAKSKAEVGFLREKVKFLQNKEVKSKN